MLYIGQLKKIRKKQNTKLLPILMLQGAHSRISLLKWQPFQQIWQCAFTILHKTFTEGIPLIIELGWHLNLQWAGKQQSNLPFFDEGMHIQKFPYFLGMTKEIAEYFASQMFLNITTFLNRTYFTIAFTLLHAEQEVEMNSCC